MTEKTNLLWVQKEAGQNRVQAGFGGCESITISATGNGLTGHYDVIEVIFRGESAIRMPAHHCISWKLLEPNKN